MLINPYAFGSVSPGDPYWANVSLLLDCDSATIVDKSSYAHSLTITAPSLNTTNQKVGTGCLDMASSPGGTGIGPMLGTPAPTSSSLDLSAGDWTIEGWWYQRNTVAAVLFSTTYNNHLSILTSGSSTLSVYVEGGFMSATPAFSASNWHHVALVMHSNAIEIYVDGVGSTAQAVTRTTWAAESFYVCGTQFGGSWPGLLDEVRVTKGVARYTSNFTPTTVAFPTHA